MILRGTEKSPMLRARLAGGLYAITIVCGIFAEAVARGSLIVPADAAATARNILASQTLFRAGLIADLITIASYLAVTLLLYELLAPVSKRLSLLAALFSLVGITTLTVTSLAHVAALLLLQAPPYLAAFSSGQLIAMALFSLTLHTQGYAVSGVFFGTYCILLGWLIVRSTFLPRTIGMLMVIAGVAYFIDDVTSLLAVWRGNIILDNSSFLGLLGEAALTVWLLVRGVDAVKWCQQKEQPN
jgi:hypothetical protein